MLAAKDTSEVRADYLNRQWSRLLCWADSSGSDAMRVGIKGMLDNYYHPAIEAIVNLPKPVIAAVNGSCSRGRDEFGFGL
ncbi:MAG: hypothetical protein R2865_03135 [Deinococcales bacterium]